MAHRAKVLVLDTDIDLLSKIYLALVHKTYKAEASNKPEEFSERIKRFKPAVVVAGLSSYEFIRNGLKAPAVVILTEEEKKSFQGDDYVITVTLPIHLDVLLESVENLVV